MGQQDASGSFTDFTGSQWYERHAETIVKYLRYLIRRSPLFVAHLTKSDALEKLVRGLRYRSRWVQHDRMHTLRNVDSRGVSSAGSDATMF